MNDLRELIGQEVTAIIGEDSNGNDVDVRCKVIDVHIEDFYFEEKAESIYIRVNIMPNEDLPDGFDSEDCCGISIDNIYK